MSAEIEVLDQLLGGDLPLNIIAKLFSDQDHCRRARPALLRAGQVRILNADGVAIPDWRYRELQSQPEFWASGTPYRMSITDLGAELVS
jgi:hypothetical protein